MNIKIAGYTVDVETSDTLLGAEGRIGEYSPIEQKIRIYTNLTKQQEAETLIHESLEAINSIYDLNLDHDEQLCKLSVAIHQILVDNPELPRLITNYNEPEMSDEKLERATKMWEHFLGVDRTRSYVEGMEGIQTGRFK